MNLILDDEKTKALLTEVLVEMLQQKREIFYDLILDALEEVGLANAMLEGEETDFVDESEIQAILPTIPCCGGKAFLHEAVNEMR